MAALAALAALAAGRSDHPVPNASQLLRQKFGLEVQVLTPEMAGKLDLKGGLIITGADANSPAAAANFSRGLIVVQIGKYFPTDMEGLGMMLERVKRAEKVKFRVYEVHQLGGLQGGA